MAIIRVGHVSEDHVSGDHVIGVRFFDDTGGDGSVTVTPFDDYVLRSDQGNWNHTLIGGYFGNGLLQVTGTGAIATQAAVSDPTGETRVTVGADANFPDGGAGRIEALNGGVYRLMGAGPTLSGSGVLEIAPVFGRATVLADGGTVSLSGFATARVQIGTQSGNGTLSLQNGGRLAMADNGSTELVIGPDGTGVMLVGAGSIADLGGSGWLAVGGQGMTGSFTSGRLAIDGAGAQVTGFSTAWIGTDPATVTDTPSSRGTLDLSGQGRIGGAGATVSLGVMGELMAGTGTVEGRLALAGGTLSMMNEASDILTVSGDVVAMAGSSWIMLNGSPAASDLMRISGAFRVEGATGLTLELLGQAGHRFLTGDHMTLIEADSFDFGPPGPRLDARVHAGFNPDFGYVFGVVPMGPGQPAHLDFEALSNMDGPGTAVLALVGGSQPTTVAYDALQMQFNITGGRFQQAWARGLDGLSGTAGNDVITLSAHDGALEVQGGAGNDRIVTGLGADTLRGGNGVDTLDGGAGDDLLFGGTSAADLRDMIYGGDGNDNIDGGAGNDELNGGNGNDTVQGGLGSDTVIGNAGNDALAGAGGSDLMFGGPGNDVLNGGFGFDRLNGGAGADRFFHQGVADHGSDWVQDYSAADRDVLVVGLAGATRAQFQVNTTTTPGAGLAGVAEAFVIYRPTGQILWALVDGADDSAIRVEIGGQVFDLLA